MEKLAKIRKVMICLGFMNDINNIRKTIKKRKRSCAVRMLNLNRKSSGYFTRTFLRMKHIDSDQFFVHTRMTVPVFNSLLTMLSPYLQKTSIREPLSPEFRLSLSLLYLSQGNTIQSLAWSWKIGKETVRQIVLETCQIIWTVLSPFYFLEPTEEDFKIISADFWNQWDLPNCTGAIDGKHIALICPPNSGSQFYNYKKFFSLVLLAVSDANYIFTYIDIGAYGSQSDSGVFRESDFGKRFFEKKLPFPNPKELPFGTARVPHFFVGDAAFPLHQNLMRPYPGKNIPKDKEYFNQRLSRARRVIENAFGILVARWRVLSNTLHLHPKNAEIIVSACIVLHNMLRLNKEAKKNYVPSNYVDWEDENGVTHDGVWRSEVQSNLQSLHSTKHAHIFGGTTALQTRDNLCRFVNKYKIK